MTDDNTDNGIDIPELSKKGYKLLKESRINEAVECFKRILIIQDDNRYALVGMGDALRKLNRYTEAIHQYRKCLDSQPENSYALFGLADCYKSLGQINRAILVWEEYLKHDDNNLTVLTRIGDAYRKARDFPKSREMYKRVLDKDKGNIYALIGLGHLHFDFKEYRDSLKYWEEIEENSGEQVDIRVLTSKGNCYRKLKDYEKAIVCFERALNIQPDNFYALYGMGDCYRGLEEPERSLEYWHRILNTDPENKVIYTRAADAHRNLGEIESAENCYRKALAIGYDLYAVFGLALIDKLRGNFEKAASDIEQLIEKEPNNYRFYVESADCWEQSGRWNDALRILYKHRDTGTQNDSITQFIKRLED